MAQKEEIVPNVFLIGVQKSATTSVYDWVAQHPEVCAPVSMKDTPFFIDDKLYTKGVQFLDKIYRNEYTNEPIILNGSAHIIFFDRAIKRIRKLNPESKHILILRNPIDRAISAYNFAVKRNLENESLTEAVKQESLRINHPDLKVQSETTYVSHGLYFKQLSNFYRYFNPEQLLILFYEDVKNYPHDIVNQIYTFLGVDKNFKPEFRTLNKTGQVRYAWIKNMIYNDSNAKSFFVKKILDRILSHDRKYRLKIFFLNLITDKRKAVARSTEITKEQKRWLLDFLINDIELLETHTGRDLSNWKIIT